VEPHFAMTAELRYYSTPEKANISSPNISTCVPRQVEIMIKVHKGVLKSRANQDCIEVSGEVFGPRSSGRIEETITLRS
jgi:hypothetical protein